jgi:hypothetical protein
MAPTKPSAPVASRGSSPADTIAPDQPPTPASTATYCWPSAPRKVTGWPMIPDSVLNCHSSLPLRASSALNQPSMVP